jgi:hypothetical protein
MAALRTRILMRQTIRYGSDHDASPICFAFADLPGRFATKSASAILDSRSRQICDVFECVFICDAKLIPERVWEAAPEISCFQGLRNFVSLASGPSICHRKVAIVAIDI